MSAIALTKLRGIARTLDDDALAALANKGLVRRAQKDLETSRPVVLAADADRVQLQVGDATVEVLEPIARCRCSCPATGTCRHILAALIFLRDEPAPGDADFAVQAALFDNDAAKTDDAAPPPAVALAAPTVASPADVLGAATDKDLQAWAGKALFKKATQALAANPQVEIESGATLVIRFPTRNIACRWIPSDGLLSFVCSCQAETVCEHVVAAVLAYQVSLGRRTIAARETVLKESSGAPRSRAEVLASAVALLREIVMLGIARVSAASVQRLTTLAVSAHGVDLPRLERMLKSLAEEIGLALRRDAQANSANILLSLARSNALVAALIAKPSQAVIGLHRTQYHDVGQIALIGVGAQHWRSKGGFHGLTVFFWDESRQAFATWNESRPVQQPGFSPMGRFGAEGPWSGCSSPRQASGSVLRLTGAWRNPQGRISGRASTQALVVGPTSPSELPEVVVEWSELRGRVEKLFGGGLTEQTENLDLVIVSPDAWAPAAFDPLRQELIRPIVDHCGRSLPLWLPFTPENESAIELLETHDPSETRGLLATIRLVAGQLCLQPVSLLLDDRIVSLNLEKSPAPTTTSATAQQIARGTSDEQADDAVSEETDDRDHITAAAVTPLGRLLIAAQAELEAIAESGIAVRRDLDLLRGAAKRLDAIGMATCSRPLSQLLDLLGQPNKLSDIENRREAAARLLRAYYTLQLAANQEAIALACAGLN